MFTYNGFLTLNFLIDGAYFQQKLLKKFVDRSQLSPMFKELCYNVHFFGVLVFVNKIILFLKIIIGCSGNRREKNHLKIRIENCSFFFAPKNYSCYSSEIIGRKYQPCHRGHVRGRKPRGGEGRLMIMGLTQQLLDIFQQYL